MLLDWRIFLRSLYFHENTGYHESFRFYEIVFSMSVEFFEIRHALTEAQNLANTANLPEFLNFQISGNRRICQNFPRFSAHWQSHRNFTKSPTFSKLLAIGEFSRITRFFPQQENFPRSLYLREIARYFSDTVIFQHRHRLLLFESREFVIAKLDGTAGRDETDGKEKRRVPSRTCRRTIENKRSVQG